MRPDVTALGEPLAAVLARVRLLAGVSTLMGLEGKKPDRFDLVTRSYVTHHRETEREACSRHADIRRPLGPEIRALRRPAKETKIGRGAAGINLGRGGAGCDGPSDYPTEKIAARIQAPCIAVRNPAISARAVPAADKNNRREKMGCERGNMDSQDWGD